MFIKTGDKMCKIQILIISIFILIMSISVFAQTHPDDIYWEEGFYFPGGPYYGYAIGVFNGRRIFSSNNTIVGGLVREGTPINTLFEWTDVGPIYLGQRENLEIRHLLQYQGKLIVAGDHTSSSSDVTSIAGWSDAGWEDLGLTKFQSVKDMIVYNGDLIVCGVLDSADGQSVSNIARWNGTNWYSMDSGFNDTVNTLEVLNGDLVAAGVFTTSGADSISHIAIWKTDHWEQFYSGSVENIYYSVIYDSSLYVTGHFSDSNQIAYWGDDSTWYYLPPWSESMKSIKDIEVHNGKLVAKEWYYYLYTWDGTDWTKDYEDPFFFIEDITVLNDSLYVNGQFYVNHTASVSVMLWKDSTWVSYPSNGTNDIVYVMKEYKDKLYVGGEFDTPGKLRSPGLGVFTGTSWESTGIIGGVHITAMEVYQDKLIVGGYNIALDSVTEGSIAQFDGEEWMILQDDSIDLYICTEFLVYKDKLIVRGNFRLPDSSMVSLLQWDGFSWDLLGGADESGIAGIVQYNNELLVYGHFDHLFGEQQVSALAAWNGEEWRIVDTTIGYVDVNALSVFDIKVLVSGYFDSIGGKPIHDIAIWDGASWNEFPFQVGRRNNWAPYVRAFSNERGTFLAGNFDSLDGTLVNKIVELDGDSWETLGSGIKTVDVWATWLYSGVDATVIDVEEFQGDLYVGGEFLRAGDKISAHIAKWTKGYATDINEPTGPEDLPQSFQLNQNYPNPFNPSTTVRFSLPKKSNVSLIIYNTIGQKVRNLVDKTYTAGEHEIVWDGKDDFGNVCATGIYFYKLESDEFVQSKKMLLLR
ncbi:MAG: T9SS C-terminal target domain-containing protein [Calditrichaeota bacterium]|nr:MAG: T9SS C-terminal target domain-containing protein [Calditrichota bacterium]